MNTRRTDDPSLRNAESQREWQLQERALREEREGIEASDDPEVADYRRIAHALRRPLPERLPSNFAFQMAQLVARLPKVSRLDLRLERWLVRGLVGAMVLGGGVATAVYGRDWLAALEAGGSGAGKWIVAAGACLLLTWGMQGWRAFRQE
jgi:hypothetical protein